MHAPQVVALVGLWLILSWVIFLFATRGLSWMGAPRESAGPGPIGGEMEPINYEELDPGVRELVASLRGHGWETTDSGDGRSKPAEDRAFGDMAHVVIESAEPQALVDEAHSLHEWMVLATQRNPAWAGWKVEASYDPESRVGLLLLTWPGPL